MRTFCGSRPTPLSPLLSRRVYLAILLLWLVLFCATFARAADDRPSAELWPCLMYAADATGELPPEAWACANELRRRIVIYETGLQWIRSPDLDRPPGSVCAAEMIE